MKECRNVQYLLKKSSRRRTVSIKVKLDSSIVVYAPQWMGKPQINTIVEKKMGWIRKKQEEFQRVCYPGETRNYHEGERFYFFGDAYVLQFRELSGVKRIGRLELNSEKKTLTAEIPSWEKHDVLGLTEKKLKETLRKRIIELYRQRAEEWLEGHEKKLQAHFLKHLPPGMENEVEWFLINYKLRAMKSRWGSCQSDGTIRLSLRLFGAPDELISYVVYHELCHLINFNHSRNFYTILSYIEPKWKILRKELHSWSGRLQL
ncbi:MAG: M48 family metallopeptidase [Spirochaetia bacterium]|nr:M48 family metallopeptidase [Spirochaetia bacterium]MCF7952670.1 M48 family metallopeptidase [Spirochaetales bacterium]